MIKAELLQYDIRYDRKEKDINFLAKQLETHLKERFNVLLSTVEYGIKDGHLIRPGTNEPFIKSVKRGRDLIQMLSPDDVDRDRENAEVIGFEKIDAFLSDPATPLGSKKLSVSPEGENRSKYKHNFYDIFTLKEKNGERYVELSRYSSALSRREYAKRLGLDFNNPPEAKELLANPIKIDSNIAPEEIHEFLHVNHEYVMPSEFERIWKSSIVQFYVKKYEMERDGDSFNAILNAADMIWQNKNKENSKKSPENYSNYNPSFSEIKFMEKKEVRQTGGQCPGKSGADVNNSPFSVSEFGLSGEGIDYEFDQPGPCKKCNAEVNCGPCGICKACDLAIRASKKTNPN